MAGWLAERYQHVHAHLFAKLFWHDFLDGPEFLTKLGVRRILQPEGWMIFSMPVSCTNITVSAPGLLCQVHLSQCSSGSRGTLNPITLPP